MTLEDFFHSYGSALPLGSVWAPALALLAGAVASAVCPCTLPMGLGMAGMAGVSETQSRRRGILIAGSFFAGIIVNLAILGALAGHIGAVLTDSFGKYWTFSMAVVSLLAASLIFLGPQLPVERLAALCKPGFAGAFAYGFIFSLGTSAAPLLLLLTIAAAQAKPLYGLLLALAFGVGRGLPFLLIGVFASTVVRLTRLGQWRRALQVLSGFVLLIVSVYYARAFISLVWNMEVSYGN